MAIQEQNIKLLASEVMDDVPEGGGQATGNVITDGASNAIFPDISELDRTYGRVNLRKTFVGVQTPDTDKYFGANVIVADPPDDPRVSCTLFTTEDGFDERTTAAARIEAYLFASTKWNGYLFEDHIAGQRAIAIVQREGTELPPVGKTLVLRLNEGAQNQVEQYIRVTRVTSQVRTFTDSNGDYKRMIVTCELSDALRTNFKGHAVNRQDMLTQGGAVIRDTNVADAARYYGASKLTSPAEVGDLTATVESIFTSLVPSAQTEVPATDVQANNSLFSPMVASSNNVSLTTSAALSPVASLFVGAAIQPGTLSITGPAALTDSNGALLDGATEVGTVDYQNGIITSAANTYSGAKTITFKHSASPNVTTESLAIKVTAESRSLSIALTLNPIPAPNTLSIHYQAQGNWYILRERGTGAVVGEDSSYGAGQMSFTTGGLTVTFGALPDVGSSVLLFYGMPASSAIPVANSPAPRAYYLLELGQPFAPGTLAISWAGGTKTAFDVGGLITNDATGKVLDYAAGTVEFSPNELIAKGGEITVNFSSATNQTIAPVINWISVGNAWQASLGTAVIPKTFRADVWVNVYPYQDKPFEVVNEKRVIKDDGAGNIRMANGYANGTLTHTNVGTINYTTGEILINKEQTHDYRVKVPSYAWSSINGDSAPAGNVTI